MAKRQNRPNTVTTRQLHSRAEAPTRLEPKESLAAKIGVRQRTVSDIENPRAARLDTVLRALVALDLELVIRPRTKGSPQDIERLF